MINNCRLYLISPAKIELDSFEADLVGALDAADVAALQLRLKDVGDDVIRAAVCRLRPLVQERNVAFMLNDRPDLAAELACDGVHIGQNDMPLKEARSIVGDDAIIGVSCHDSRHLAMEAAGQGADYVAFGAFFASKTKQVETRVNKEIIEIWSETTIIPVVAIGGITVQNCEPLIKAGADFIAVSSGVWDFAAGPAAAVKAFNVKLGGKQNNPGQMVPVNPDPDQKELK